MKPKTPRKKRPSTLAKATEAELRAALRKKCQHLHETVVCEGMSGTLGTVTCLDCGHQRDWDAY